MNQKTNFRKSFRLLAAFLLLCLGLATFVGIVYASALATGYSDWSAPDAVPRAFLFSSALEAVWSVMTWLCSGSWFGG